ncbi:MAG: class I SAM-dependent methyltransferase [bacterium]
MCEIDWSLASPVVQRERVKCLIEMIPKSNKTILEIGSRGAYMTKVLAQFFEHVTALDLEKPDIDYQKIKPVKGDVTSLRFPDNSFDVVLCSEVLEHINPSLLQKACDELVRVAKNHILIGVPYNEDIRIGRVTCINCGVISPGYGHVNSFNEQSLLKLFRGAQPIDIKYVGQRKYYRTNSLSAYLFDLSGNPYGSYEQEERCPNCDGKYFAPEKRSLFQKILTKMGFLLNGLQYFFTVNNKTIPMKIHILFSKNI